MSRPPRVETMHDLEFNEHELATCKVCMASEGELLTHCPGYTLNMDTRQACYQGNVIDFDLYKVMKYARDHT